MFNYISKITFKYSWIISINTFNPTKGIVFNKGGNIVSRQMKVFQVRENGPQQILVLPMTAIKEVQKKGIIWAIEHAFVWCIIYEQHVPNMNIRTIRKKNVKVLVENWFIRFIWQKMWISHAKLLVTHSRNMYKGLCFVPYVIHVIIYCDIGLQTKCRLGIEQGISARIPSIRDRE
jgi:hypothetical protein